MECTNCNALMVKRGLTDTGKQRYLCRRCKRSVTPDATKKGRTLEDKKFIVDCARKHGVNRTARTHSVSKRSIYQRRNEFNPYYKRSMLIY